MRDRVAEVAKLFTEGGRVSWVGSSWGRERENGTEGGGGVGDGEGLTAMCISWRRAREDSMAASWVSSSDETERAVAGEESAAAIVFAYSRSRI